MLCLAALSGPLAAATVSLHANGRLVVLEGRIDVGDFEKVEALSRETTPTGIYLASHGGNLVEAVRIGWLVRRLGWETISAEAPDVPAPIRAAVASSFGVRNLSNNVCASACFFIFISGIYREGYALGIHPPFMAPDEIARISPAEASKRTDDVRTLVERFFMRMGVPLRYVDAMYAVPEGQTRWLTAEEIRSDFHGFVPEVREWVRSQCGELEIDSVACRENIMTGIRLRTLQEAQERSPS